MATQDTELRVDLVFEGGGVKGIALAGAVLQLDARGYQPQRVAGTSAGAITAAIVAAGYRGSELEEVVRDMQFPRFADTPAHPWAGFIGEAIDVVRKQGIHSGDYFHGWISDKLAAKGVRTFGDLIADPGAPPTDPARYKLQVIASDLTTASMLVLPRDAGQLGLDPDRLPVADAVRMSMAIPIFFRPWLVTYENHQHVIVDGGLLSNFPVWLFDVPAGQKPGYPTFGLLLRAPGQRNPIVSAPDPSDDANPAASLLGYVKAIADTAMEAHDRFAVDDENFARTIALPTLGVKTTEFDISPQMASRLLQSGRDAVDSFLQTWNFAQYVTTYRS